MANVSLSMPDRAEPAPVHRAWSWRRRSVRARCYQSLAVVAVILLVGLLLRNTLDNMHVRGIRSGFDFLFDPAGFDIGEAWLRYDSSDPYWRALAVGLVNTLRVAVIGMLLTALLGTLLGVGRFSSNALVRGVCYGYVELFRNVPLLLQLLMWYLLLTEGLPSSAEPASIGGIAFLSKAGLSLPLPTWRGERLEWELPEIGPLGVSGGLEITPEFIAVLGGLVLYTSAFVAENVRAGIASVPRGQIDAALSLNLSPARRMRLIVLPQALRVIIPPVTNHFLNLTKNSSLAVAIGYPDIVSVSNTALNQTGRAVECIAIIMAVYLCLSLGTSMLMNVYNRRKAIVER